MSAKPGSRTDLMWGLLKRFVWIDQWLQERLAARGWEPLSRTESQIMFFIHAGVARPTEVARALGLSRQAINKATRPMIARGLVTVGEDPDDGRCKVLGFAGAGEPLRRDAVQALGAMETELARRLGKRSVDALRSALHGDWGEAVFPEG